MRISDKISNISFRWTYKYLFTYILYTYTYLHIFLFTWKSIALLLSPALYNTWKIKRMYINIMYIRNMFYIFPPLPIFFLSRTPYN